MFLDFIRRPIVLGLSLSFLAAFAVLAILFRIYPNVDIVAASLFFRENGDFIFADSPLGYAVYYGVDAAATLTALFFIAFLLISFIKRRTVLWGLPRLFVIYLALCYIIGCGIIVNMLLKDRVGRPRPFQTTYFMGNADFAPAFKTTQFGGKYASFVSGHAAFGFFWLALAFPMKNPIRRRRYFSIGIFLGTVIGLVRMMQGKHFLSDVVFSFFFIYSTAAIIWFIIENLCHKELEKSGPYG